MGGLLLFAQWSCRGPCGKQKGKALSGATIGSVVANSPSPQDHKTKDGGLLLFAQLACKGPCGEQKGKAGVKRSDHRERSSQFSLSALNSLQGVDFQPCRLFLCPKSCTKNAPAPFSVISVNKNAPCFYTQGIACLCWSLITCEP